MMLKVVSIMCHSFRFVHQSLPRLGAIAVSISLLAQTQPANAGKRGSFDLVVEFVPSSLGKDAFQLTVERKQSTVPWSLNEISNLSKAVVAKEGSLPAGLRPWGDQHGFSFQAGGLAFLMTWDGTLYVKNEGLRIKHSLLLLSPGKVVMLEGGFQEKLEVRSSSFEFHKGMSLEDFVWRGLKGQPASDFIIKKGIYIEAKDFRVGTKLINAGILRIKDNGRVTAPSIENQGVMQGANWMIDTAHLDNRDQITSVSDLRIDTKNTYNGPLGKISASNLNLDSKSRAENLGILESTVTTTIWAKDLVNQGTLYGFVILAYITNFRNENGQIKCSGFTSTFPEKVGGTFENEGGEIHSSSNLIIEFKSEINIRDFGILKSNDIRIISQGDITVETGSLLADDGNITIDTENKHKVEWKNGQIQAKNKVIKASHFLEHIYVNIPPLAGSLNRVFKLTQPYDVAGVIHLIPLLPVPAPENYSIEIQADLRAASGIVIDAPNGVVIIGDESSEKPVELLTDGELSVHSSTFDLKNGIIKADRTYIEAPQGITTGRLVRDPMKDSFVTLYCHRNRADADNLGSYISNVHYSFLGEDLANTYDGNHLFTLPVAMPNPSSLFVRNAAKLIGPWQHYGTLETQDLILEASKDSFLEGSRVHVSRNLVLNGTGNLLLRRRIEKLTFNQKLNNAHYGPSPIVESRSHLMAASEGAQLRVEGEITRHASGSAKLINQASILFYHNGDPGGLKIEESDFKSGFFQLFYSGPSEKRRALNAGTRSLPLGHPPYPSNSTLDFFGGPTQFGYRLFHAANPHRCVALYFHQMTDGMNGAVQVFKPQSSTPNTLVRHAGESAIAGSVSASCVLAFVGSNGLTIGSAPVSGALCQASLPPSVRSFNSSSLINPFAVTLVSDADLSIKINSDLARHLQAFTSKIEVPIYFKMHERFWFDSKIAEDFYREIQDHIVILTPKGEFKKPNGYALLNRSPKLLLDEVRSDTEKTLKRGFIYPGRPIDLQFVQELHRNATEYLNEVAPRGITGSEFQKALVLRDTQSAGPSLPKKPAIFYFSMQNESGKEELHARTYFPYEMIKEAHGRGGDRVLAQQLVIVPENLSPQEMIAYFNGNPSIQAALVQVLTQNENTTRLITDAASSVSSLFLLERASRTHGSVTIHGDIHAGQASIVAMGDLKIYGDVRAGDALLASLLGNTQVESKKERILQGSSGSFYERISQQARVHVDGIIRVLAGQDIQFTGAETYSGLNSHFEALGNIWDVPVPLLYQNITEYASKKKRGYEITRGETQHTSRHQSGERIQHKAQGSILAASPQYQAGASLEFEAGQGIQHLAASHSSSFESHITTKRGGFGGRRTQQIAAASASSVPASYRAPVTQFAAGAGGITLTAPVVSGDVRIITPDGKARIDAASHVSAYSSSTQKSNVAWQSLRSQESMSRTYIPAQIAGRIEIDAKETIIQSIQGQTRDLLEQIKQRGDRRLTIEDLEGLYIETSKKIQGPSQALSAVVAIGVGVLTYGTGTGIAGSIGLAAEGVGEAMFAAGFSSVCAQTAVRTLAHQGNLGRAIGDTCSEKGLKSVATAAATAGVAKYAGNQLGLSQPKKQGRVSKPLSWVDHAKKSFVNSGSAAVVDITLGNRSVGESLKSGAIGTAIRTAGGSAANQIGEARADGSIDLPTQIAAHGVLGLGIGGVLGDATAGAIGAMSAELFAESFAGDKQFQTASEIRQIANWAKIAGAVATMLLDRDVQIGSQTANNAVDNNFAYRVNRQIRFELMGHSGEAAADPSTFKLHPSHTYIVLTDDQGKVTDTFSWGNDGVSWHHNAPNDLKAGQEAVDKGLVHDISMLMDDDDVREAYTVKSKEAPHANYWVVNNCKFEADALSQLAAIMHSKRVILDITHARTSTQEIGALSKE